jgi:hypothetical protein
MIRTLLTIVILAFILNGGWTSAQVANRFDILITEIFADPTPSVGMPPNEFVEIKNVSAVPFNIRDWKVCDGSSVATITTNFILEPDSMAIICTNSATAIFSLFGTAIGVSNFPSLDNDADLIFLRSKEGTIIHAVNYNKAWYKNDLKSNGGWTLEMIDTKNPCSGITNWSASTEATGGTPGKKNSVSRKNVDDKAPALTRTYTIDSVTIAAVFDEPIDSLSASFASKYVLGKDLVNPLIAIPFGPLFKEVILKFSQPLSGSAIYNLIATGITDCSGNSIDFRNKVKAGRPLPPDTFDVTINEILFNPKSDGFDFIELYNKSRKIIDLQHLYLANRNSTGSLTNVVQLSVVPYLLFPEEYIVITENIGWLRQNYVVKNYENLIELSSLPSLPDDKGTLVIANIHGKSIEEIQYDSKWHFALIDNKEGISLERIDYNVPAQNKNNWTSAASTAGFGTPGYQNSQFKIDFHMQGMVSTSPKVFSPDNDGFDDLATITYQMTTAGFVADITIYDANGRTVRYLAKNATLALQGSFRWDGLDDNMQRLPVGIYIVFTEIFNLQGKTKRFKNVITLARKF